jgi:hypothetical protein
MSIWTILWLLWGAAFVAIEGTALAHDHWAGTLSDHLRLWFRTDTKLGRTAWLIVSGVFFAWFVVHIAIAGSV